MAKINVRTSSKVIPMCYAYSTPEIKRHDGWTKIGYTEKQDVDERIKQQSQTIDAIVKEEWRGNAIFEDGSGEYFTDHDFHAYLRKNGVEYDHTKKNEWFHIDGPTSRQMFYDFRTNKGILEKFKEEIIPYELREEQAECVNAIINYKNNHSVKNEFLMNCKPRYGKTITAYDLVKKLNCKNTLIVTNRPAIANSWYSDYVKFIGDDDYYYFVSETSSLKGEKYVLSYKDFERRAKGLGDGSERRIEFVSLQDLKGSIYFGGNYDKLKHVKDTLWDLLIVDETHEGVDTYKTDAAFDQLNRKFTLHLSGTPFKALANAKFDDDAIFNWTYADEQKKKNEWNSPDKNPYEELPKLNLYTYQMSEIIKDEIKQGISIDDEVEEYAFDLNEFFKTNENGSFIHGKSVDKFLDALTTQEKYPFSTPELREELKHTFWFLDRVASAKALEKKLKAHPVFQDYTIIVAAGDQVDDMEGTRKSYNRVKYAIENFDKTITLSVGQLTTGVTIKEWTAVLMLCNCSSPSLYMQAAFRAQNPCMFRKENGDLYRKENSYVFDFDPARTLIVFEEFANGLSKNASKSRGTSEERKQNVRELLNFFPVVGEDENGEMIELDAEKVLTIPRKIKSTEVVKKGFMSNFLFQNIGNIFNAPKELIDIIQQFTPIEEPKNKTKIEVPNDVVVDNNGEVVIDNKTVIGTSAELFGDKIYEKVDEIVQATIEDNKTQEDSYFDNLKEILNAKYSETISENVQVAYEDQGIKKSDIKQIERETTNAVNRTVETLKQNIKIERNVLNQEKEDAIKEAIDLGKDIEAVEIEYSEKSKVLEERIKKGIEIAVADLTTSVTQNAVKTAETKVKEHKKDTVEDKVRDHLRGFSRTIPSFLMAYGDDNTTLENFDSIIPNDVFKEVTSISLEEFRMLRDGGDHQDEEGNIKHFDGLFDGVVFNDSIKEFLKKKEQLSNYFDETQTEDIFDYIPPQKTNQIYTPKNVVKMMVDMLEKENPGCFDDNSKTFADLYMKSGLYIAEIVKRLYRSNVMKEKYPNNEDRLRHIFEYQVYGLAPTEIIYRISKNFILGFDKNLRIEKHNLRLLDSLPYAENGTLSEKLDELFGQDFND